MATEGRAGKEEVQRGIKRAVFGERRTNQDETPQDLAIPKYVFSWNPRIQCAMCFVEHVFLFRQKHHKCNWSIIIIFFTQLTTFDVH